MPIPNEQLVSKLIAQQFPEFANLSVYRLNPGGWDNVSFRLGQTMLVKLPRDRVYAAQPQRECEILGALAGTLPLEIPRVIALGSPGEHYPHQWSILEWIEGDTVSQSSVQAHDLAGDLARFLRALHNPATQTAPEPGIANFWRGGALANLTSEFKSAASKLADRMDMQPALAIWENAIAYERPVRRSWVHGDVAPANLLHHNDKLCAAIDFGLASAGDPACDLAIAWLAFDAKTREQFLESYSPDDELLLLRAKAWALWKAVLVLADMSQLPAGHLEPRTIVEAIYQESYIA